MHPERVASAVGYEDKAIDYLVDACSVDLADEHGNTADGIHIAAWTAAAS